MQLNRAIIWGTFIAIPITSVIAFMFPVPDSWPLSSIEFYLPFIGNVIMACLHVGAAVLFVTNLDVYKSKLRQAYTALAFSVAIVGLGMLQISVIAVLDAWRSPYVLGGGMMFPFLIAGLIIYLAIRKLGLLVGLQHPLARWWIAIPITLFVAYTSSFLPHVALTLEETAFDTGIGIIAWAAGLLFCSSIAAMGIKKHAGSLYSQPMTWLARAAFISGLVLVIQCVYYLITTDYDHIVTRINSVISIGSGVLWLRAGYAFALTKYYKDNLPLLQFLVIQTDPKTTKKPETAIDMVTYAAGLVSNSTDIDPILDDVRAITASLRPGETPSNDHTKRLVEAYLKIERYLTTKEAARTYSQKELRAQLAPSLQKLIAS